MRIGIDLMGSESSPDVLFNAVLASADFLEPSDEYVVFVTKDNLQKILERQADALEIDPRGANITIHTVIDSITAEDDPLSSVRLKKDSSIVVGVKQVAAKKIDAFVSAGSTGALVTAASLFLKPLGNIQRPALLAVLPSKDTPITILDVGGRVSCTALDLVQYAHMGAAYQSCVLGIEKPAVGLLNIGTESNKGTLERKEAFRILKECAAKSGAKLRFMGNVEGRDAFQKKVDVLVTDGFSGNVMLKTSEGISDFIFSHLQQLLKNSPSEQLHHVLDTLQKHFSYEEYPGAIVCGVEGVIVKCHGASTVNSMANSIQEAVKLVRNRLIERINAVLSQD